MKAHSTHIPDPFPTGPVNDSDNNPHKKNWEQMIKGNPQNDNREQEPLGHSREINDILPTATGEFLEEMRQTFHRHLDEISRMGKKDKGPQKFREQDEDEYIDVIDGDHPYRSEVKRVPKPPMYPYHEWFI